MRPLLPVVVLVLSCGSSSSTDGGVVVADAGVVVEADGGAPVDAGSPYVGVFSQDAVLEADGGVTPFAAAANLEFLDGGQYRTSLRSCTGAGSGQGLWEARGADAFLPDDKPGRPGRVVRALDGGTTLTITNEASGEVTRWQRGGRCLLGCDGGVEVTERCATPRW
jgi:hypothetical protein